MLSFLDAVAAHPDLELHSLLVLKSGRTLVEHYWTPWQAEDRPLVYSVSKTLTASAIGLAIGEGRLQLDDPVVALLPEADPGDPVVSQITVHHLLSMSTGHDQDTIDAASAFPESEWVSRLLAIRPQTPVGSRHVYNNGASFLLGEIIRRVTGTDLVDYLRPRLTEPMGIELYWDTDRLGRALGWTGAHLRVADLAKIGELLRCDGAWNGIRLLPEGWVTRATSRQIPTLDPTPEWSLGYGYQCWMSREGFRLDGAFGQFSLVIPERELVIAITSAQSFTQELLDLVWDQLIPELPSEPIPAGYDALPVPNDAEVGSEWAADGPATLGTWPTREEQQNLPELTRLWARRDGAGYRLGFTHGGAAAELTAEPGSWRRQELVLGETRIPVAVAAGSDASGALEVRIAFIETPHTLRLRLDESGSAAQTWTVSPLHTADLTLLRIY